MASIDARFDYLRWRNAAVTLAACPPTLFIQVPPSGEISQVVEHFFRHESARVISTLARIFGPAHLDLAEDVVQEALMRAFQTWPFYGIPKNPSAWIMQAAKNACHLIKSAARKNLSHWKGRTRLPPFWSK